MTSALLPCRSGGLEPGSMTMSHPENSESGFAESATKRDFKEEVHFALHLITTESL